MGGSSLYVTTELRARDPENDTSIPTPVSSSPSTPTSSNSFKRKFEDEPPYLDISGGILANKYQRSERFEHCFSPSESPQASQYSESPVPPSPQANTTGFEMSFIMQPISFVFGKITAFTTDVWNQFKASQTSSEDDTVQAETGSTQEPTQEPTPEATPEPTPQLVSEAEPVMTAPAPKPTQSLPPVRAWNFSKNSRTAARPNIDIWAQLQATVARRDALKKKYIGRSPYKVAYEERNRRLHRVNVSKVSGSPLISSRARGEEIRRSRKPRPTRTVQDEGTQKKATEEIQRKAIEETQRKAIGDDLTLEAYLSTLRLEREANFKNYHTISQERARREEEIQRLKEQRKEPIVKPLSEATMSRVRQVIVDRERGKIIIENSKARVSLYSEDMWRLNPNPPVNHPVIDSDHKLWLNDSIIDLYLHMVAEKYNKGEEPKKAHAFGAFFWSQLLNHGPKKVEGLTRRSKVGGDNLLRLDFLFIPANFNSSHWTLGVIKPQEKRLEFYDSMKGGAAHRSQIFFRAAREYLINEIKGKAKLDQPWDQWWGEWTESFVKDCPAQTNMYDCGVFTCKHAEVLARGRELSFTQADMPTIRYRMVAEILAGELGVA